MYLAAKQQGVYYLMANIGFDAKRAFHNRTGLGNYSRTLLQGLASYYPQHHYFLFNPTRSQLYSPPSNQFTEVNPSNWIGKLLPSMWRRHWMKRDIERRVELFHGLSHELPAGLHKGKVKTVVTMHDLIFEHYPEQYHRNDILVYRSKFKHACENADHIIAISESTKNDLIQLYQISPQRISVCYQSCDPRFLQTTDAHQLEAFRHDFNLPFRYFISVGSIIERKNLLHTCHAFCESNPPQDVKLIVLGKGGAYKEKVKEFIQQKKLSERILFLDEMMDEKQIEAHLPLLYQNAIALLYPSVMEGFGIPVLEAMSSSTAVITSNQSSLKEAGGDAAYLVDPHDVTALSNAMNELMNHESTRQTCIAAGHKHLAHFSLQNTTHALMEVYQKILTT